MCSRKFIHFMCIKKKIIIQLQYGKYEWRYVCYGDFLSLITVANSTSLFNYIFLTLYLPQSCEKSVQKMRHLANASCIGPYKRTINIYIYNLYQIVAFINHCALFVTQVQIIGTCLSDMSKFLFYGLLCSWYMLK